MQHFLFFSCMGEWFEFFFSLKISCWQFYHFYFLLIYAFLFINFFPICVPQVHCVFSPLNRFYSLFLLAIKTLSLLLSLINTLKLWGFSSFCYKSSLEKKGIKMSNALVFLFLKKFDIYFLLYQIVVLEYDLKYFSFLEFKEYSFLANM